MGKRRRNRDRSEGESKQREDSPKALEPEPSTFKSILGRSQSPRHSTSNVRILERDNGSPPKRHSATNTSREEIRAYPLVTPHVEPRWEYRLPEHRKDAYHYSLWRDAYDNYLRVLFDGFQNILNSFKVRLEEEISFETFSFFIYEFSSGYITPYS